MYILLNLRLFPFIRRARTYIVTVIDTVSCPSTFMVIFGYALNKKIERGRMKTKKGTKIRPLLMLK